MNAFIELLKQSMTINVNKIVAKNDHIVSENASLV